MQRHSGPQENASQSFPRLSGQILGRCNQFSEVLNGRNQEVLDRLFDQSSPASTFEAMSVGSVRKTTFYQNAAGVCDQAWLSLYWLVDALDPRGLDRDDV